MVLSLRTLGVRGIKSGIALIAVQIDASQSVAFSTVIKAVKRKRESRALSNTPTDARYETVV